MTNKKGLEGNPVCQYYKNYIKINGEVFLWDSISTSRGKRLAINNINNFYRPVIQYLGPRETTFSITIKYGGIYKSAQEKSTTETDVLENKEYKMTTTETTTEIKTSNSLALKQSFLKQKKFIQDLVESDSLKTVEIVFPDGDIAYGIISSATKGYEKLGLNTEQLEFVKLYSKEIPIKKVDPNDLYDIKKRIIYQMVLEQKKPGFFARLKNKINSLKNNIKNSKFASQLNNMMSKLKTGYNMWRNGVNTVKNYMTKFQNVLGKVQDKLNTFVSQFEEPSKMLSMLKDINSQIVDIAKTPGRIVAELNNICEAFSSFGGNSKNTFKFTTQMFEYAKDQQNGTTKVLSEYYNLNTIYEEIIDDEVRNSINVAAFTNSLTSSSEIDYDTDIEIKKTIDQMGIMYKTLINEDSLSEDIKDMLYEGYNLAKRFLTENVKAKNNIKEIEIKTPKTLEQIVYEYYGNDQMLDEIIFLNKGIIKDILSVKGKIKVFENE